jgi:hypothetical protein
MQPFNGDQPVQTDVKTQNEKHVTVSTSIKSILVLTAVTLPIVAVVVFSAGNLLAAMGDAAGEVVLTRVSQAAVLVWSIDLVLLLLAMGCDWLVHPESEVKGSASAWKATGGGVDGEIEGMPPVDQAN